MTISRERIEALGREDLLALYDTYGPETYGNLRFLDPKSSLVAQGPWDLVQGRLLGSRFTVIDDLDIKTSSLRSSDDWSVPTLSELIGGPELLVVRLGFAPSKNAELGNYIFEALWRRMKSGLRPTWVSVEDPAHLPASISKNQHLERLFQKIETVALLRSPDA